MSRFRCLGRAEAMAMMADGDVRHVLMVDTYDGAPANMAAFRPLNPFHLWPAPVLAVPGMDGRWSRSLEGIWQGLKVIEGKTDFAQFAGTPRKRPTDAERRASSTYRYEAARFQFRGREIGLREARFRIYAVAYLELLDRVVPAALIARIRRAAQEGCEVAFYDWDDNGDIADIRASYSHSSLLRAWFAGELEQALLAPARRWLAPAERAGFEADVRGRTRRYRAGAAAMRRQK